MVSNKNGWISSYERQFGMAPTQNNRGIITTAVCNFCKSFGRETKVPSPTPVTGMSNILANESHTRNFAVNSKLSNQLNQCEQIVLRNI